MKKLVIMLVIVMSVSLCACENGDKNAEKNSVTEETKVRELTEFDKAAIYTVNILKENLKNPHSLIVYSIGGKHKGGNEAYYFRIEYSAENNIGGTVEDTLYFELDPEVFSSDEREAFEAKNFGSNEIDEYFYNKDSRGEEVEFDVDTIMDNLDK